MKTEIKFNHNEESLTDAMGIKQSPEQIAMSITKVVTNWAHDESGSSSMSILAEHIHRDLPYETILLLATREINERLEESFSAKPLEKLLSLLELIDKKHIDEDIERKVRDN
jgi:hypothetical protein